MVAVSLRRLGLSQALAGSCIDRGNHPSSMLSGRMLIAMCGIRGGMASHLHQRRQRRSVLRGSSHHGVSEVVPAAVATANPVETPP